MSISKLDQLRATKESLDSFELAAKFSEPPVALDNETVERYQKARNEYIHRRMLQVFYDHIPTLENGEFDLPQLASPEEEDALNERRNEVQQELLQTAKQVNQDNQTLQAKYSAFCARREELSKLIQDIEANPMSQDLDEEDAMDDVVVDHEEFTYQGQHLADVTRRKEELQLQLERIRNEKAMALKSLEETTKQVDDLQKKRGVVVRAVSPETLEELEADTTNVRRKVEELKEMSDWYGGLCEVMEEIGGIKLLSVDEGEENDDEVVAKIQLLEKHEIHVSMSSRGSAFHVVNAKFASSTLVQTAQDTETKKSSVQMNIPPLDDLVRLCSNLESVEDLRFLLRETMARIQTITARVNELAILRTRFLTKIGKAHHHDYSFGGENQEIVCSLNEGITAVLRLTPDCPKLDGSIFLEQLVGVGGWNVDVLDRIKDRVNAKPNCKGPLALMEALVEEIRRVQTEDGVSLPGTPSMPVRK